VKEARPPRVGAVENVKDHPRGTQARRPGHERRFTDKPSACARK
jgi:hypothetical protein